MPFLAVCLSVSWFEFGWYSCPTCPPGGWDCSDFTLESVSESVTGKSVAKVNRTMGCYSKYLIDTLNISANQLVNPATRKPLVPPGCVGFSAVYDCGAEPYRTHLLQQLKAVMENLAEYSGGIVIDRWDFVGLTNANSDDGLTAYVNPPSVKKATAMRSTTISLQQFMESVSEVVHKQYKRAVSINGTFLVATGI